MHFSIVIRKISKNRTLLFSNVLKTKENLSNFLVVNLIHKSVYLTNLQNTKVK